MSSEAPKNLFAAFLIAMGAVGIAAGLLPLGVVSGGIGLYFLLTEE